jgi:biopolymer transport protein ExbD
VELLDLLLLQPRDLAEHLGARLAGEIDHAHTLHGTRPTVGKSTRARCANIERLHAENPQGSVVIQADKNSRNGLLVQVMDAARLAGVGNVSLAVERVQ